MRKICVGTVSLRKTDEVVDPEHRIRNQQERFDEVAPLIVEAGKRGVDFLCLPEYFSVAGMTESYDVLAEAVPGGISSEFCSRLARENNLNLITTLPRRLDDRIYNAAVIFNRTGGLVGIYHKVHPAPDETTASGAEFPVFDVEGVTVGLQVCFDLNFPEGCRILALKGAEIIFWPTMWSGPSWHFCDCIMRARAMENFVNLVASAYVYYQPDDWRVRNDLEQTAIVSWDGFILAQTGTRPGLATAVIDLDERRVHQAERDRQFAMRRPETYGELVQGGVERENS